MRYGIHPYHASPRYAAVVAHDFAVARAEIAGDFHRGFVCRSIASARLREIGCFEAEINIELRRV